MMFKYVASKLPKNLGLLVRLGLFFLAAGVLAALLAVNSLWVAKFRATAMRFVPTEAVSFVVIPNLQRFMTFGASSVLAVTASVNANQTGSDFISLMMPRPRVGDRFLPAQCRTLRDLSDLEQTGLDPYSSFSIARLDSGSRAAFKVNDEAKALTFLSDILFPTYARLSAPQIMSPADEATRPKEDETQPYKFSFSIVADGVEVCLRDRPSVSGTITEKIETRSGALYIPLRITRTENGVAPVLEVSCSVGIGDEQPKPCKCELFQLALGDFAENNFLSADCATSAMLKDRQEKSKTWRSAISAGKTVAIGSHYVAKVDDFVVVEQLANQRAPRNLRIAEPRSSLVRDDSFLRHFERIIGDSGQYSSTVLAGARPDWIVEASGSKLRGFPLYLMTPIGIHFRNNEIHVNAVTNLQPQDMAIIQTLAAREARGDMSRDWRNWSDALGAKLADSSLKMYARSVRVFFSTVDEDLSRSIPLGPVAIDVMEEGASTVIASITDINTDVSSGGKSARLALEIPNINADYAGRLVSRIRRQAIMRQAKFTVEAASRMMLKREVEPNDLLKYFPRVTCEPKYWRLKSLVAKNALPQDNFSTATFRYEIEIDDEAMLKELTWSTVQDDRQLERLLSFEDANAALWGDAYYRTVGFYEASEDEVDGDAVKLISALYDLLKAEDAEQFQQGVESGAASILAMAQSLEARRLWLKALPLPKISGKRSPLSDQMKQVLKKDTRKEAVALYDVVYRELANKTKGAFAASEVEVDKDAYQFISAFYNLVKVENAERFEQELETHGAAILTQAQSLEARLVRLKEVPVPNVGGKRLALSDQIEQVLKKDKREEASALYGFLSAELRKKYTKMRPRDIAAFCVSGEKKRPSSPVAFYNVERRSLFLLDAPEDAKTLLNAIAEAHAAGKLLVSFTTANLASLLKKGGTSGPDVDRLQGFPFPIVRLSVSGRDSGAGAEVRSWMKKVTSSNE